MLNTLATIWRGSMGAIAAVYVLLNPPPISAMEPSAKPILTPKNLTAMRQAFSREFTDWIVVNAAVKTHTDYRGQTRYWILTLQPKTAGQFIIRYGFERSHTGYSKSQREYQIVVGPTGCPRIFHHKFHPDICLGDRIMVPIEINAQNSHYTFSRRSQLPQNFLFPSYVPSTDRPTFIPQPSVQTSPKPVPNTLMYLGRDFDQSPTRGGDLHITWRALLRAQRVGTLNLTLQLNPSQVLQELVRRDGENPESDRRTGINPDPVTTTIVVLPDKSPITTLPFRESVNDSDLHGNGSSGSHQYPLGAIYARVGDRLWLNAGASRLSRDVVWNDRNGAELTQSQLQRSLMNSDLTITEQPVNLGMVNSRHSNSANQFDNWLPLPIGHSNARGLH
jgi:hypothetical protein